MSFYSIAPVGLTPNELLAKNIPDAAGRKSASELTHAAGEFESILIGQWLQGAESTFGGVGGSSDDEDSGDEQMRSLGVQALAKSFTEAGGIGLAKVVNRALQRDRASGIEQAEQGNR